MESDVKHSQNFVRILIKDNVYLLYTSQILHKMFLLKLQAQFKDLLLRNIVGEFSLEKHQS
jgi:hypothetical protein